ncbi:MAG TPA: HD domain-containing protein, partial [Longimicrobium sp.]|nr:HD domain-containing protein [Longimicrobium sp.]
MSPSAPPHEFEVVRDPLWNTIRLDPTAVALIDTPEFQRLRNIRQLGLAYLVYPGATHTRFDHALGVYHLARWAMGLLGERGELAGVDPHDCALVPYAALLHDVGHYPFSHALEELGGEWVPGNHEALTGRFLSAPRIEQVLEGVAPGGRARVEALIRARSDSPLQGLVSGSLDLDKIEYLNRDALFCGVPYGAVDVDRLLHALTLVRDPESGRLEIGIHEKGLSALESLLFAKYQMFRNVYWHHAVRAGTVLYQRLVQEAADAGLVTVDDLIGRSDEGLLT